ncbi:MULTISPECIES: Cmx/CmrA family chloramphenicol efflux MFS transporter [Actinomadura]|uniref:Cmx/CmrA family chloramphenicol efflux MFS transporter n=1 Tax=Actinomadura yumaensis TaxID=111807 RepID=A0ABW2CRI8_9ACTN|nr:Cmx/CmrA family chloramphenicol efflux MFS transporter [Actinomadura sp. J1-007]MWK39742.1 Cmx/CmrA family chloramphenicol efflux MFS transporter [Actinomadura sp. J1-007]
MPLLVYILGLAVFAQGTSEFMLSGLLPEIAADLHVSVPRAGLLTSMFAIGMAAGAPVLAVLARRWPHRRSLVAFLAAFAACHVAGALTGSYAVLLATRVIAALANAGFWAVASAAAIGAVAPHLKARAMSVVVGGVTLACVAGVPGGALLGQQWGWRSAFWAVAALSAAAIAAVLATMPAPRPESAANGPDGAERVPERSGSVRDELRTLTRAPLLAAYGMNALVQGATFCTFTYLALLVTDVAGLGDRWVPAALVLFGTGALAGITAGGRIADARPLPLLAGGMTALAAGWAVLALTAAHPAALLALVPAQGMIAFGIAPALTSRAFYLAPDAPTLAGGFSTAAFNVGNTAGPWLGGLAIGAGLGYRSPAWVSALMMAAALGVLACAAALRAGDGKEDATEPETAATY